MEDSDAFDEGKDTNDTPLKDRPGEYYALLNVENNASPETIREKYKHLAVLLHPDKQPNEEQRITASDRFQRVQRAYEVLSNPHRRALYDAMGEKGLQYEHAVGQKFKTPAELREEIERLAQQRANTTLQAGAGRGTLLVGIDARALTLDDNDLPPGISADSLTWLDRLEGIEVRSVSLRHTFVTDLGKRSTLNLTSRLAQGGRPGLVGTVKHQFSPRFLCEADMSVLSPRQASLRMTYQVDPLTTVRLQASSTAARVFPPTFNLSLSRALYPGLLGTVSYQSGWPVLRSIVSLPRKPARAAIAASGLGLALQSDQYAVGFELSEIGSVSLNANRSFEVTSTTNVTIGAGFALPGGLEMSIGAISNWKDVVRGGLRLGVNVSIAQSGGVSMRIRVIRQGQVLILPIALGDRLSSASLDVAFWAVLLPAIGYTAAEYFILRPARNGESRVAAFRKRHREEIERRKMEAKEEIELLRVQVSKRAEAEESKNGLVILRAEYGNPKHLHVRRRDRASGATVDRIDGEEENDGLTGRSEVADVTIAVQALVNNSQLAIPGGRSKAMLMGFYDPCAGTAKELYIQYVFKGRLHEVQAEDTASIMAPLRGHLITTD